MSSLQNLLKTHKGRIDEHVVQFCILFHKAGVCQNKTNQNHELLLYLLSRNLLTNKNSLETLRGAETHQAVIKQYNEWNKASQINELIVGLHFKNCLKDVDDC